MKYIPGENIFEKFREQRKALILLLRNGDITKKEYIEESYIYLKQMDIKPFKIVDNFEKAVYNYQYYNIMAKHSNLQAKEIRKYGKHEEKYKEFLEKVRYYYHKKNKITLKAIELLDFYNVEAYYIKVKSDKLKNKLFEIIFYDYDDVVFHSKSKWLADKLKQEGIFKDEVKHSIVSSYVNEKY